MVHFLLSFIWSSIGLAILIYGKKSDNMSAVIVGLAILCLSYILGPLLLSVISVSLLAGLYYTSTT